MLHYGYTVGIILLYVAQLLSPCVNIANYQNKELKIVPQYSFRLTQRCVLIHQNEHKTTLDLYIM